MQKKIYILVDYRNLYRQGINRSRGIDLEKVKSRFISRGFHVEILSYEEVVNKRFMDIQDSYIFYTGSESLEYKNYIQGILYELGKRNVLIPRYDIFLCHEDKCHQEIVKKDLGIDSLNALCFGNLRELKSSVSVNGIKYPVILKKYNGAGSISVYKVDNRRELYRKVKKINRCQEYWLYYAKLVYKFLKKNLDRAYLQDDPYMGKFIVQEFVPDLKNDWKVLAFGRKMYALYRGVRSRDFRASGSGKFQHIKPDDIILDFAYEIYMKLDVPFLSMDICMDEEGNAYLIEFQGIHFGPYTLMKSKEYYVKEGNGWKTISGVSDLALEYADAVLRFIEKGYDKNG